MQAVRCTGASCTSTGAGPIAAVLLSLQVVLVVVLLLVVLVPRIALKVKQVHVHCTIYRANSREPQGESTKYGHCLGSGGLTKECSPTN